MKLLNKYLVTLLILFVYVFSAQAKLKMPIDYRPLCIKVGKEVCINDTLYTEIIVIQQSLIEKNSNYVTGYVRIEDKTLFFRKEFLDKECAFIIKNKKNRDNIIVKKFGAFGSLQIKPKFNNLFVVQSYLKERHNLYKIKILKWGKSSVKLKFYYEFANKKYQAILVIDKKK
jgi:hypothetical protein